MRTVSDRIASKIVVDPATGCHVWTGRVEWNGYARTLGPKGKSVSVHRFTYEAANGAIPDGLVIDHLCRNRACCNPAHLEAVTQRENVMRSDGIAAKCAAVTHCPRGHAYDALNTHRGKGKSGRKCRACQREVHNPKYKETLAARRALAATNPGATNGF